MNRKLVAVIVAAVALLAGIVPAAAQPAVLHHFTCEYVGAGPGLVTVTCGQASWTQPVVFFAPDGTMIYGSLERGTAKDTTVFRDGSFRSHLRVDGFTGYVGSNGPYVNVDLNIHVWFAAGSVPPGSLFPATPIPERMHLIIQMPGRSSLPRNYHWR